MSSAFHMGRTDGWSCFARHCMVWSTAQNPELVVYDAARKDVRLVCQVPLPNPDESKYFIFSNKKTVYMINETGALFKATHQGSSFEFGEVQYALSKSGELFSKFHYLSGSKLLFAFESQKKLCYSLDFSDPRIPIKPVLRFDKEKITKVRFINRYLIMQVNTGLRVYDILSAEIVIDLSAQPNAFTINPRKNLLLTLTKDTNTVDIYSLLPANKENKYSIKYICKGIKNLSAIKLAFDTDLGKTYFVLVDTMKNRLYSFVYDDSLKVITHLYTFEPRFALTKRMYFDFGNGFVKVMQLNSKRLEFIGLQNIFKRSEDLRLLTYGSSSNEEVFGRSLQIPSEGMNAKKNKPIFFFDDQAKFVCQKGIFSYEFKSQKAIAIHRFEVKEHRYFNSFDFGPRVFSHELSVHLVSFESRSGSCTNLVIQDHNKTQVLNFPELVYSQLYLIDVESKAATFFGLNEMSDICSYIEVSLKRGGDEYQVKNLIKLDLETHIEKFFVDQEKHLIYFVERLEDKFEILVGRINRKSEHLLEGSLIRLSVHFHDLSF
jgi:hypothetical protein